MGGQQDPQRRQRRRQQAKNDGDGNNSITSLRNLGLIAKETNQSNLDDQRQIHIVRNILDGCLSPQEQVQQLARLQTTARNREPRRHTPSQKPSPPNSPSTRSPSVPAPVPVPRTINRCAQTLSLRASKRNGNIFSLNKSKNTSAAALVIYAFHIVPRGKHPV
jgi:hypothetical protein